jgi:hypothetical protein
MQVSRLLAEASAFAATLPPGRGVDAFVAEQPGAEAVKTALGLSMAGYTPILGAKPHHLTAEPYAWMPVAPAATVLPFGPAPAFCTSGSTGEGTIIRKTWAPLLAEAQFLQSLLQVPAGGLVVSLVPPVHIYGFLYGVLLPHVAGADVEYATYDAHVLGDADLVVAVPALWSALKGVLAATPVPFVVSSGAPWDALREAEFLALGLPTRLLDILGSTETGGLGYRPLGNRPQEVFRAFDGVELMPDPAGGFRLRSPYTEPPGVWTALADSFVLAPGDPRFFVYKGRQDRVFKLGGRRFALAEIERHLSTLLDGAPVRCRFRDDPASPKGGELIAYAATATLDFAALRRDYLTRFDAPFPARIFLVDGFAPNAAGKVSLPELEANARKSLP